MLKIRYQSSKKVFGKIYYTGVVEVWQMIDANTSKFIYSKYTDITRLNPADAIIDAKILADDMLNGRV